MLLVMNGIRHTKYGKMAENLYKINIGLAVGFYSTSKLN